MNNFNDIPIDPDTTIIEQSEIIIGSIPAMKQYWNWDGIKANSLIFHSQDVEQFSDNELLKFIKEHSETQINSSATYKRNDNGYCFFNYNFKA